MAPRSLLALALLALGGVGCAHDQPGRPVVAGTRHYFTPTGRPGCPAFKTRAACIDAIEATRPAGCTIDCATGICDPVAGPMPLCIGAEAKVKPARWPCSGKN